jgi:hypothetical protein
MDIKDMRPSDILDYLQEYHGPAFKILIKEKLALDIKEPGNSAAVAFLKRFIKIRIKNDGCGGCLDLAYEVRDFLKSQPPCPSGSHNLSRAGPPCQDTTHKLPSLEEVCNKIERDSPGHKVLEFQRDCYRRAINVIKELGNFGPA